MSHHYIKQRLQIGLMPTSDIGLSKNIKSFPVLPYSSCLKVCEPFFLYSYYFILSCWGTGEKGTGAEPKRVLFTACLLDESLVCELVK